MQPPHDPRFPPQHPPPYGYPPQGNYPQQPAPLPPPTPEAIRLAKRNKTRDVIVVVGFVVVVATIGIGKAIAERDTRGPGHLPPPDHVSGGLGVPTPAPAKKQSSVLGAARVTCAPSGPASMACSVAATGLGKVKACWDVTVTCGGTAHTAHACSDAVAAGSTEVVVVRDFSPSFTAGEVCDTAQVLNLAFE